ncbi:phospholipase A and acyltransferase 4-like [Limanda limanda]|uniref:phospholipase A and acyltransferase 4-like n=1 Tax=Limanda limanda TaxID=27771 RepID=UPI0029C6C9C7|nr:phospholipase A and acyltransferase 4-like [Limanda limanda]
MACSQERATFGCWFKGNKGDLIEISHRDHKQWAIYIGGNEVVMLVKKGDQSPGWLESLSSSTGKVKREKLAAVVGNHRCRVNNLLDDRRNARDPSVIVKKACAMVGRNLPYNVATYNSWHFATEMRYDKAESWLVCI